MKLKHWGIFIVLNIVISALVTLALLSYWESAHPRPVYTPVAQPASSPAAVTPLLAPVASPASVQPALAPSPFAHTTYIVQSGDTLSAISRRYGLALEDLLIANNLTEESVLHVGQQIKIPTRGQPVAASTPAATPTATPSELVMPAGEISVEIRQVIARGDPTQEAVVIANLGRQVSLQGWRLADTNGDVYTFPDLTLWPGGTITVHTGSGPDSVSDLYWKRIAPVWAEPGDVATLSDANGNVVAQYQLP